VKKGERGRGSVTFLTTGVSTLTLYDVVFRMDVEELGEVEAVEKAALCRK
jgi:hypothetical protein